MYSWWLRGRELRYFFNDTGFIIHIRAIGDWRSLNVLKSSLGSRWRERRRRKLPSAPSIASIVRPKTPDSVRMVTFVEGIHSERQVTPHEATSRTQELQCREKGRCYDPHFGYFMIIKPVAGVQTIVGIVRVLGKERGRLIINWTLGLLELLIEFSSMLNHLIQPNLIMYSSINSYLRRLENEKHTWHRNPWIICIFASKRPFLLWYVLFTCFEYD